MGLGRYSRSFFTNWREYDAPLSRKLGLTVRNRARTMKRMMTGGQGCCGHPGEPGC